MTHQPSGASPAGSDDPFGTAGLRRAVLDGWSASAARFREDANAEEDLALGGYRDRLVVELASNAADAATRAGVPGRLLLAVREIEGRAVLVAANTGAVLDAAGVQALATLRASAKRDGTDVGRFGVGFAAVLAVTDEPAVVCRSGGVRFGAADTRELVRAAAASAPGLDVELTRRDGHVPILRLPFPAEGTPPDGFDTAVLLPLRDAAAEDVAVRLLDEVGDPLLLALPGLASVTVEVPDRPVRTVRDAAARWHVVRREGDFDVASLTDRPTEERSRRRWDLAWAVPRPGTPPVSGRDAVVHAPTPTDEPLPWPALLIGGFPLDPARRHVAAGPATDALVDVAGEAFVDLMAEELDAGTEAWPLLPTGLPRGVLDGALREAVLRRVPAAPVLRGAGDPTVRIRPRDAVLLERPWSGDVAVLTGLATWIPGLVRAPSGGPPLTASGAREVGLADVVEALPMVEDPAHWHGVYRLLAPTAADPLAREVLSALPVPLADGRLVRGARGLVILEDGGRDRGDGGGTDPPSGASLGLLGVRTVHPDAAHPLLEQLGAVRSSARAVLDLAPVRAAVEASADAENPAEVAEAVLALVSSAVRRGELRPDDLPWLGELALTDDDGELAPATALLLPDSSASGWFDPDEIGPVAPDLVDRWGEEVLGAVGVLTGPALVEARDVVLDPEFPSTAPDAGAAPEDLDGWPRWCAAAATAVAASGADPSGSVVPEMVAVRDLDAVLPDAVPDVVRTIASDARLRATLRPVRVDAGGRGVDVLSYTAWWLRLWAGAPFAAAGSGSGPQPFAGLLPPAPAWLAGLDADVQRALGVLLAVEDVDADALPGLLDRLADPAVVVPPAVFLPIARRLAVLAARGCEVEPPSRVRGLAGGATVVRDADEVTVLDAPMYLPVLRGRPHLGAVVVPVPAGLAPALADMLGLRLAGELLPDVPDPESRHVRVDVPESARALLPDGPAVWCEHDALTVEGVEVEWWVEGSGHDAVVHASTLDGLARGLSWAADRWASRGPVADVLQAPAGVLAALIEEAFMDAAVIPAEW